MLPLRPALCLSLLTTALVAANLVHAAVPASEPFTPEQQHVIQQLSASEVRAAAPTIASEAAGSVAKTIAGEKQAIEVAKDTLEVGRKSVDWLFSFLAWLTGAVALFGMVAPWVVVKNYKEQAEKSAADLANMHREAEEQAKLLLDNFDAIKRRMDELEKFEIGLREKNQLLEERANKIEQISQLVEERAQNVQKLVESNELQLAETRKFVEQVFSENKPR